MWLVTRVWEWFLFILRFFAVNILSNVIRYREERTWKNSDLYALFYSTTFTQDEIRPIESSTIIQRERGRVVRTELITKWREYIVSRGKIFCADPPPISLRARRPANSTGYNPFARPAYCMPYRLARCKFRNTWRRRV